VVVEVLTTCSKYPDLYSGISFSAYLSHARATRTAVSIMRRQRFSKVSLKPGIVVSEGQRLGLRYSGKFSGENSAVGLAQAREGST
jgi:hypothetical protein